MLRILICSLLLAPVTVFATEEEWRQWRGANRDGSITGKAWPNSLDEKHLQVVWKKDLEPSYSGPIITERMIFTTETRKKETEVVTAFDRQTGTVLWEKSWKGSMSVPFFAKSNGDWIRSTPTYDGESLYVAGMRDVLVCLNAQTGEIRWKLDCVAEFSAPLPAFGFVCSPLVVGDFVYVQAGAGVVKAEKKTGKVVWRKFEDGGGMWGSAFSSPILTKLNGRDQLIVQTRSKLAGLDPETGDVLWSQAVEAFRGMNIVTPTVIDQAVFTSSYGGGSFLFTPPTEGSEVKTTWKNKVQGYMSSPIIHEGHAYLHLRNQRFACLDLKTGKEAWISKPYGKYWSLIRNGDRLLALDETGDLHLIELSPKEFRLIESRHLSEDSTWGHLAVAGSHVAVRALNSLTLYRWQD